MIDPRLISAMALLWLGGVLIVFVVRTWSTHPINHVFTLGRFVTEEGLRAVLGGLPIVLFAGLLCISGAAAKIGYSLRWANPNVGIADFFGAVEAAFTIIAAGCVTVAAWRAWRRR